MRALFLEFPDEVPAWEVADEYMFGPDVLVAAGDFLRRDHAVRSTCLRVRRGWTPGPASRSSGTAG